MRKIKSAWIGLLLVGIMLISTFAYAGLQSFRRTAPPQSNVIDYELDSGLRNALIQQGATIIKFEYNENCEGCVEQKFYLEQIAEEFKEQVFLEEIVNTSIDIPKIMIASIYGNATYTNATQDDIFNGLCELMTYPPVACVAR